MSSIEKEKKDVQTEQKSEGKVRTLMMATLGLVFLGWKSKVTFKKSSGSVICATNFSGSKRSTKEKLKNEA